MPTARRLRLYLRVLLVGAILVLAALFSCTNLKVRDCGGKVLGRDEPRIRSSHFRMLLADLPSVSRRLLPFASMSALAYAEDAECGSGEPKLSPADRAKLESVLSGSGWREVKEVEWSPPCEDQFGLFARVWELKTEGGRQVVVAFRGTWGAEDFRYGNLHWMTRFSRRGDQYSAARALMQRVLAHFSQTLPHIPTRYYTTGHSLGGGLAQHVLYSYPEDVAQAFVFDPSSVTGFVDQAPASQVSACRCRADLPAGEVRIYRAYDSYEILSNLRIFHKLILPPERHIQEIRFPHAHSHSMKGLAYYFLQNARKAAASNGPWFAGQGNYASGQTCTSAFIEWQRRSCAVPVSPDQWNRCPQ
jgi:pimeloyl-ACP methyl ester carboxylesterase